jgi:hypothetical protein
LLVSGDWLLAHAIGHAYYANAALCKSNPLNPAEGGSWVVRIEDSVKTYNNLFARISAYDNLYFAWRAAARGKRGSPEVAAFEYALTDNLLQLSSILSRRRSCPTALPVATYPLPETSRLGTS